MRHGLGDGEFEGRGDAPGITYATRCGIDEASSLLSEIAELHLRALAIRRSMIESEWQATQSVRKYLCAHSIAASRAALKERALKRAVRVSDGHQ